MKEVNWQQGICLPSASAGHAPLTPPPLPKQTKTKTPITPHSPVSICTADVHQLAAPAIYLRQPDQPSVSIQLRQPL